jgi:hypothetical protein
LWDALYLLTLAVFGAGGAWAQFRRVKRDLNGMGKKLNDEIAQRRQQTADFRLLVLKLAPDGERDELIEKFLGKET